MSAYASHRRCIAYSRPRISRCLPIVRENIHPLHVVAHALRVMVGLQKPPEPDTSSVTQPQQTETNTNVANTQHAVGPSTAQGIRIVMYIPVADRSRRPAVPINPETPQKPIPAPTRRSNVQHTSTSSRLRHNVRRRATAAGPTRERKGARAMRT